MGTREKIAAAGKKLAGIFRAVFSGGGIWYFLAAAAVTWVLVASGADWFWYRQVYGKPLLARCGLAANLAGWGMPFAVPVVVYAAAVRRGSGELRMLAAALARAAVISAVLWLGIKCLVWRRQAGLYDLDPETRDYSAQFGLHFLGRGIVDGWPSGHTMHAMTAAAVIAGFYPKRRLLRLGVYGYVLLIGLGMSFFDHWLSDVAAGLLLGCRIGRVSGLRV